MHIYAKGAKSLISCLKSAEITEVIQSPGLLLERIIYLLLYNLHDSIFNINIANMRKEQTQMRNSCLEYPRHKEYASRAF